MIDYLEKCVDNDFPELKPERTFFAFRNGQLDITTHPPVFYDAARNIAPHSRVAIKFFDCEYDPSLEGKSWREIGTPAFDTIFIHQGYTGDTMRVVYAMLGRLLYEVGEHDNFQVCPFFKGVAGCGKSTVAQIVQDWFPPRLVSTISANMEDKFGLAGIVETYICMCTEVTKAFPLNRGVWQSMVTGESVVVPRKNKDPVDKEWTVPMAMFGNEAPQYIDKSGSVHRRMALFCMRRPVDPARADSNLLQKLRGGSAALLVKCNDAYREFADEFREKSFWAPGVASQQMIEWHEDVLCEIDPLTAFLTYETEVGSDPVVYRVSQREFEDAFRTWGKERGVVHARINELLESQHLDAACERKGIKQVLGSREENGPSNQRYLEGIRLREEEARKEVFTL